MQSYSRSTTGETAFEWFITQCVLNVLSQGATSFDEIILGTPSIYPSLLLQTLRRLAAAELIPNQILTQANESVLGHLSGREPVYHQRSALTSAVPHPLDFDWRFTEETADHLLDEILSQSGLHETVALIGTPSVYRAALRREVLTHRNFVLIDTNQLVLSELASLSDGQGTFIACDLMSERISNLNAQVVVTDPPWYQTELVSFLHASNLICADGGTILMSVPSIGTRPSIKNERLSFLKTASDLGLCVEQVNPLALTYDSPFFEFNALRAEGIMNYPRCWRRGDLITFGSSNAIKRSYGNTSGSSSIPMKWWEENVDGVRVRIRPSKRGVNIKSDFADPTLISIVIGDILPSISRRNKHRNSADVWTSGNRIFMCQGVDTLREVLRAMIADVSPKLWISDVLGRSLTDNEQALTEHSFDQITRIITEERREMISYGG